MRRLPLVVFLSMAWGLGGCLGSGGGSAGTTPVSAASRQAGGEAAVPSNAKPARQQDGSATLSWYPPTDNADGSTMADLVGYRIYYGTSPNQLNRTIAIDNPGLTRYVVENLAPARWHFAMTSLNASGKESARSSTVSKRIG